VKEKKFEKTIKNLTTSQPEKISMSLLVEDPQSEKETLFFEEVLEDSLESDDDNEFGIEEDQN